VRAGRARQPGGRARGPRHQPRAAAVAGRRASRTAGRCGAERSGAARHSRFREHYLQPLPLPSHPHDSARGSGADWPAPSLSGPAAAAAASPAGATPSSSSRAAAAAGPRRRRLPTDGGVCRPPGSISARARFRVWLAQSRPEPKILASRPLRAAAGPGPVRPRRLDDRRGRPGPAPPAPIVGHAPTGQGGSCFFKSQVEV
jgi:hypothetical protein